MPIRRIAGCAGVFGTPAGSNSPAHRRAEDPPKAETRQAQYGIIDDVTTQKRRETCMAKGKIREAGRGANTAPASFGSAAISATAAVLKSCARGLESGTAPVAIAPPPTLQP